MEESTPRIVSLVMIITYAFVGFLFARKFGFFEKTQSKSGGYMRSAVALGSEGVKPRDKSLIYLEQPISQIILGLNAFTLVIRVMFFAMDTFYEEERSSFHKIMENAPLINSSMGCISLATLWLFDVAEYIRYYQLKNNKRQGV
jgi:hypothetical protein